jgi:hypothetical protein
VEITREELGQRMEELARNYAETHDPNVKRELEQMSLHIARLDMRNAFMVLVDALHRAARRIFEPRRYLLRLSVLRRGHPSSGRSINFGVLWK